MFSKWNIKKVVIGLTASMLISFGIGGIIFASTGRGGARFFIDENGYISKGSNEVNQKKSNNGSSVNGSGEVNQEKSISTQGVNEFNVDITSGNIYIIPEDRTDVKATLTGFITPRDAEPRLEVSLSGDKLLIEAKIKGTVISNLNCNLELKVYIPKTYVSNLTLQSTSGNINIKDLNLKDFKCQLTSGKLKMDNLNLDNMIYNGTSGEISGNNISTKATTFKLISGNVKLDKFKGDLKGSSTSGKVYVSYDSFSNNINLSSISGEIAVRLPEESEFYLNAKATSGNVSCNFPIVLEGKQKNNVLIGTVKNDKNKINISLISGSISID
jgi:lia operon protein LiaG